MLAQVLGAERERFLLGEKNIYIIEGNWPAGAKMEVRLDGHEDFGEACERGKGRGTEPL